MIEGLCHCGAAGWRLNGVPASGLVCNCSLCRRTGAVWAYGHDGADITLNAPPGGWASYIHGDRSLATLRCPACGITVAWRALAPGADGQTRAAVNLRLADPAAIRHIALRRLDGADSWEQAPADGRVIGDLWL